ncbi:NUDIX domain-containing protein [Micromonospora sp. NPDC004336]
MGALTWAVAAVVTDDAGRVLLCRQGRGERRHALPGGRLRPAESPTQAVLRDVRAETGWDVEVVDLIGLYHLTPPCPRSPATSPPTPGTTSPPTLGAPSPGPSDAASPPTPGSPLPGPSDAASPPTADAPPGQAVSPALPHTPPGHASSAGRAGPPPDVLVYVFRARVRGAGPIGEPVSGCRVSWHDLATPPEALTPTTRAALADALAGRSGVLRAPKTLDTATSADPPPPSDTATSANPPLPRDTATSADPPLAPDTATDPYTAPTDAAPTTFAPPPPTKPRTTSTPPPGQRAEPPTAPIPRP